MRNFSQRPRRWCSLRSFNDFSFASLIYLSFVRIWAGYLFLLRWSVRRPPRIIREGPWEQGWIGILTNYKAAYTHQTNVRQLVSANSNWRVWTTQQHVGKLLARIETSSFCRQQFAKISLRRSHTPTWVCQHEPADISLKCESRLKLTSQTSLMTTGRKGFPLLACLFFTSGIGKIFLWRWCFGMTTLEHLKGGSIRVIQDAIFSLLAPFTL